MTDRDIGGTIAALFDADVGVGVTDPRVPQPALLGGEGGHLTRAIDKRQREFAAGRAAARLAMAQRGGAALPIHAGDDRAPIWPKGWRGSISHKSDLCAAVVTQDDVWVGLDLEEATGLDEKLVPSVCSNAEISQIEGVDKLKLAKLIFSAKEAAYKAQYPATGQLFGFDHLNITLDREAATFTARFLQSAGPIKTGTELLGRYVVVAGHIVTAVSLPHSLVPDTDLAPS